MSKAFSTGYPDNWIVQFGNWIFHVRNFLFPVFYIALFIPSQQVFNSRVFSDTIGLTFILLGIVVRAITIGLVYIIRGGKNRQIYAEELVTGGIYSLCRNPMYLGNILLLMGFGAFANSLLFMLLFFPLFVFFYYTIIRAEEAFLLNKFGIRFHEYRLHVNALIPNVTKINCAFQGQTFNLKKVIKKEYNSLFIYLTGILLLLIYQDRISPTTFFGAFVALFILYIGVKFLKYQKKLN